jgi:hypothetical protein
MKHPVCGQVSVNPGLKHVSYSSTIHKNSITEDLDRQLVTERGYREINFRFGRGFDQPVNEAVDSMWYAPSSCSITLESTRVD